MLVKAFLHYFSPTAFNNDEPWRHVLLKVGANLLLYAGAALIAWLWWFWLYRVNSSPVPSRKAHLANSPASR